MTCCAWGDEAAPVATWVACYLCMPRVVTHNADVDTIHRTMIVCSGKLHTPCHVHADVNSCDVTKY